MVLKVRKVSAETCLCVVYVCVCMWQNRGRIGRMKDCYHSISTFCIYLSIFASDKEIMG